MVRTLDMKDQVTHLISEETLPIWNKLTGAINLLYDVDKLWDKGFGNWKVEYKYRRDGKEQ